MERFHSITTLIFLAGTTQALFQPLQFQFTILRETLKKSLLTTIQRASLKEWDRVKPIQLGRFNGTEILPQKVVLLVHHCLTKTTELSDNYGAVAPRAKTKPHQITTAVSLILGSLQVAIAPTNLNFG